MDQDGLSLVMTIKQGERQSLVNYLEHVKSERNAMITLFGENLLDIYVERSKKYIDIWRQQNRENGYNRYIYI